MIGSNTTYLQIYIVYYNYRKEKTTGLMIDHTEFWVRAKTLFISFTLGGPTLKLIIYLAKL